LNAGELINKEVSLLEDSLMPRTSALDWSVYIPSWLEGDLLPSGIDPVDLTEA
jgi:hypothetical protein